MFHAVGTKKRRCCSLFCLHTHTHTQTVYHFSLTAYGTYALDWRAPSQRTREQFTQTIFALYGVVHCTVTHGFRAHIFPIFFPFFLMATSTTCLAHLARQYQYVAWFSIFNSLARGVGKQRAHGQRHVSMGDGIALTLDAPYGLLACTLTLVLGLCRA